MASASAKRLHWSLVVSVAAHLLIVGCLPGARVVASHAVKARPMRVVRAYHAAVIPPQLVSVPALASMPRRRAPSPRRGSAESPARTKGASDSRTSTPVAVARPPDLTASARPPALAPSAAIRPGPPEGLNLQVPAVATDRVAGIILPEPAPLPGEIGGGDSATGEGTGAAETGTDIGNGSKEGGGSAGGEGGGGDGQEGTGERTGSDGGQVTVSPSAVSLPKPHYPHECRRRGQEGTVRLRILVLPDGSVGRAEVVKSSRIVAFDRAAREGAQNWRFRPARRGDTPIGAWVTLAIVFRLEDARR